MLSTGWRKPTEGFDTILDQPVLQERIFEKNMRLHIAFAPDFVDYYARFSILEKNETYMKVFEEHITYDAPYTDSFNYWAFWEVITPDPRSHQVVFRKQFTLHWIDKPLIWELINSIAEETSKEVNDLLPPFF